APRNAAARRLASASGIPSPRRSCSRPIRPPSTNSGSLSTAMVLRWLTASRASASLTASWPPLFEDFIGSASRLGTLVQPSGSRSLPDRVLGRKRSAHRNAHRVLPYHRNVTIQVTSTQVPGEVPPRKQSAAARRSNAPRASSSIWPCAPLPPPPPGGHPSGRASGADPVLLRLDAVHRPPDEPPAPRTVIERYSCAAGVYVESNGRLDLPSAPHFRHGSAAHQLREGVPLSEVQQQLGHDRTTIYTKLTSPERRGYARPRAVVKPRDPTVRRHSRRARAPGGWRVAQLETRARQRAFDPIRGPHAGISKPLRLLRSKGGWGSVCRALARPG